MRVQVATVYKSPEPVFRLEKEHRSDRVVLIVGNQPKDSEYKICEATINQIKQVYGPLGVPVEVIQVDPFDFLGMVRRLGLHIQQLPEGCSIVLNGTGGRRTMAFALLFAAYLVRLTRKYQITMVNAPEDEEKLVELLLPPAYSPDKIDIFLLHGVKDQQSVADMGDVAGISQPSASARLKKLANYGYIRINGRERILTPLGTLMLEILGQYSH